MIASFSRISTSPRPCIFTTLFGSINLRFRNPSVNFKTVKPPFISPHSVFEMNESSFISPWYPCLLLWWVIPTLTFVTAILYLSQFSAASARVISAIHPTHLNGLPHLLIIFKLLNFFSWARFGSILLARWIQLTDLECTYLSFISSPLNFIHASTAPMLRFICLLYWIPVAFDSFFCCCYQ